MITLKGNFKRTGRYLGVRTYEHILTRIRGDYYTLMWYPVKEIIYNRIQKPGDIRTFFQRIVKSFDAIHENTDKIIAVSKTPYETLHDTITLTILGFPKETVLELLEQPYVETNYNIIRTSLKTLTKLSDIKQIIETLILWNLKYRERLKIDHLMQLFNGVTGRGYVVLYFPEEDPKYKYVLLEFNNERSALIDAMKPSPSQPYCIGGEGHHKYSGHSNLIRNVVHFCHIKPSEYSLHLYDGSKWVKIFNRIKCKKASGDLLLEVINRGSIDIIKKFGQNALKVRFENSALKLVRKDNGKVVLSKFIPLISCDAVYLCHKHGNTIDVVCLPLDDELYYDPKWNTPMNIKLVKQDELPFKVFVECYGCHKV